MIRARLDQAREKDYRTGVIGFRARPDSAEPYTFTHHGQPVVVIPCVSALAVREALLEQPDDGWLVIITDRTDEDLGAGILAHLVGLQLRTPDPWDAVRHQFNATALDTFLTRESREVASGLLDVTPVEGWHPAPAGVLSRDHMFAAVADALLDLNGPPDVISVLGWALRSRTPQLISDLRSRGRDQLTDAVLAWIADGTGVAGPLVHALLREGKVADLAPLGVVLELLVTTRRAGTSEQCRDADLALARLQHHWAPAHVESAAVDAVAQASGDVVAGLLSDDRHRADVERTLARADALIAEADAGELVSRSDLLPSGLRRRLHTLAGTLQRSTLELTAVERDWERVQSHQLAATDRRTRAFHAAVRLRRWLSTVRQPSDTGLAALTRRQLDIDGWVDSCVNAAAAGGDDDMLGSGLAAVLARVQETRDRHDEEFAAALATAARLSAASDDRTWAHEGAKAWPVEHLLPDLVLPMSKKQPVLFLILDGMSTAASIDIMASLLADPAHLWAEVLLDGSRRRTAALAALPSLTSVSRTSMLCGRLTVGEQTAERRGYAELTRSRGLEAAPLFHKADLDTVRQGLALADAVRAAVDDTETHPLVSCVLNTIDDALDRSDPAGTTWTLDNVKHLANLLSRAREAGRVVILTADHGHVIERRAGAQRSFPDISSGRSRSAEPPAGKGEVAVEGERVLLHGGQAVLAVSERLRYGPLKAGYHGGAAAAEVVVPVIGLVPSQLAQSYSDSLAPPQEPDWWLGPLHSSSDQAEPTSVPPISESPTLFDEPTPPPSARTAKPTAGERVVSTETYHRQREVVGRVSLADDKVARLIDTLAVVRDHRVPTRSLATILGISPVRVSGALSHVSKVLNVEGYPVVRHDIATDTLILDPALLRDQFGISL